MYDAGIPFDQIVNMTPNRMQLVLAERGKESLQTFIRLFWPMVEARPYTHGWHIDAICEHLKAVRDGEIKRLIINVPPRHMKSYLVSVMWPSWVWATDPGKQFVFLSYAASLSTRDNNRARRLVKSQLYQTAYPNVRIMDDQDAKVRFDTTANGYRFASSVKGTLTGEGGDVLVIDDPINAEDARSKLKRDEVNFWWDETLPSRLNNPKTGAMILVMQRLHEEDSTGHILSGPDGQSWDHLCLPGRFELSHPFPIRSSIGYKDPRKKEGELLWPEQFGDKEYTQLAPEGGYVEAGQIQQRPAPRKGGMFQREDFQIETAPVKLKHVVRRWDFAGSKNKGDYTVGVLMGEREDGLGKIILDVKRMRERPGVIERTVKQTAQEDAEQFANQGLTPTIVIPQDPGQAGIEQRDNYAIRLQKYYVKFERETSDKVARAMPYAAQCEAGRIYLRKASWNEAFIQEHLTFPAGKNDDQVDAAAGANNELAHGFQHGFW